MLSPAPVSLAPIWIAVDRPQQAAAALATVFKGRVKPLLSLPGAFTVTAGNHSETTFEVYPANLDLGVSTGSLSGETPYTASPAALSTPTNRQQIEQVAAQAGWTALYCGQAGNWDLVELWIENHLLLELLTPALAPAAAAPVEGFIVEGSTTEGFTVKEFAPDGFAG